MPTTKEEVIDVLKTVFDPEIPVNIYDLGLIYDVDVQEASVAVKMSLTSQSCPSAQAIPDEIRFRLQHEVDVEDVSVEVVWEPAWGPERISAEGKRVLGME